MPDQTISPPSQPAFRILAVDDDTTILDLYERILCPENSTNIPTPFNVTSCAQGVDAVDAVKRSLDENSPYALIFLDLNMPPGPDGQWTAEEIHRLDPDINIVMVTGYRSTNIDDVVQNYNFSDKLLYLQKPFHRQEIIQFATALTAKWQAEKKLLTLHSELENLIEKRTAELVQSNKLLRDEIENRKKVMHATITAIALTVEKRDPYTSGHQQRVAQLAEAIARQMGLSDDQVEGVSMAAAIHDIGKISLPAEILAKPVRLTDIEMSLIQVHSRAGYDILRGIEFPWPIADIVLQHHERMNGSGYPQGLAGEDILLEARIVGVADVVETMASHRPYRPSMGIDKALEEIETNKGVLYDPRVVETCLTLLSEKGFSFST